MIMWLCRMKRISFCPFVALSALCWVEGCWKMAWFLSEKRSLTEMKLRGINPSLFEEHFEGGKRMANGKRKPGVLFSWYRLHLAAIEGVP